MNEYQLSLHACFNIFRKVHPLPCVLFRYCTEIRRENFSHQAHTQVEDIDLIDALSKGDELEQNFRTSQHRLWGNSLQVKVTP